MRINNIFYFATKELSQDAFFLWLLGWLNPKIDNPDPKLKAVAKEILKLL